MGTTAEKLNKILDSKAKIKAAIEAKGVSDVGDVLANYPDKIASIQSGGGSSGFTGHADVEGLKAIGWTDEDIEYYQTHGVNWNEEDDAYHKVPQDNIDLYGVLTIDNIQEYKDRIVYLPKIDTSKRTSLSKLFKDCSSLIFIPMIDTSSAVDMSYMFAGCSSLIYVPKFDTSNAAFINHMFINCYSITSVPQFDTSRILSMSYMFTGCYSLIYALPFDASNVVEIDYTFNNCVSMQFANISKLNISLNITSSSLFAKDSLLYIINNAAPTKKITITLSAYCYNKYNADPDVVAALEAQPNVSLASA